SLHTYFILFFFTATTSTTIYTLSLHDALPIYRIMVWHHGRAGTATQDDMRTGLTTEGKAEPDQSLGSLSPRNVTRQTHSTPRQRSEEHTSELQSRSDLVCRLLLEKKKKKKKNKQRSNSTQTKQQEIAQTGYRRLHT